MAVAAVVAAAQAAVLVVLPPLPPLPLLCVQLLRQLPLPGRLPLAPRQRQRRSKRASYQLLLCGRGALAHDLPLLRRRVAAAARLLPLRLLPLLRVGARDARLPPPRGSA